MDPARTEPTTIYHVVALPYPGRGHINPMMNLCKLIASRQPEILITFVVTEEWLGHIGSEPKPDNIRFGTIPNVIPSELAPAKDFSGFLEAVSTKTEAPFEVFLDHLEYPTIAIVADTYLVWVPGFGNRRNIPVASLWIMSASVFSIFHHFNLLEKNGHFPVELSERGHEIVDYIPGLPPIRLENIPTIFYETSKQNLHRSLECVGEVSKAQYLLFTSVYELEAQVIDSLQTEFPFPVCAIGPAVPYFQELSQSASADSTTTSLNSPNYYLEWLDSQHAGSVLYFSLGSFLSVSSTQMDEIVAGVRNSGVRFLFVTRGEHLSDLFKDGCGPYGDDLDRMGIVVPWCDQLRVLSHSSVGGFWTHCGFNSTLEALYAGVPMLTLPIFWDQVTNSKQIVEDWRVGCRVKREAGSDYLVSREEISELVKRFMDSDSDDKKEMKKRAGEIQEFCQVAISEGGSSETNLDVFVKDIISKSCSYKST
ncbi:hypothetical protein Ddye_022502 [Dipteronia dyeriana]|uniref:Glycosyltransferase n=1 Tax=Dipteronia dyeriana TaxID=168575 RepID=A0AAD9WR96_9ROSI|nr:hypothetical protein Ddye_022502 [Dipteronia dyeriana]